MNIFMDDVDHELSVLISQRPKEERAPGQDGPIFKSADNDFARSLGCQDCKSQSIKHGLSQDHVIYDTVNINMPQMTRRHLQERLWSHLPIEPGKQIYILPRQRTIWVEDSVKRER